MNRLLVFLVCVFCIKCANKEYADLIIEGQIYTVDSTKTASAMAIKDGQFVAVGNSQDVEAWKGPDTKVIQEKGTIIPGFIEGHGHFYGVGLSRVELNLLETSSWEEIVSMTLADTVQPPGTWIIGRGWHQDKWDSIPSLTHDGYPYHDELSRLTPDHPVLLIHASGHGLFANQRAMEEVGLGTESADPIGGRNVRDVQGKLIGVFEERAMKPFNNAYNEWQETLSDAEREERTLKVIREAQLECLENGITSFQDAGSKADLIQTYHTLAQEGKMDVRLWVMLRDSLQAMKEALPSLAINEPHPYFFCNSIKSEVDGALGSYGAWLLEPYFDKPGFVGQNTTSIKSLTEIADLCVEEDIQLCVHAIGDQANRIVLDMMDAKTQNLDDHRWRIEHAQHLSPKDIPRFAELGIIASMQSVHCTSDARFVEKRLGEQRARQGAYVWQSLIKSGARVSNGTDAPVEDINPIANYYSAVTRKYMDGKLTFFPEEVMTREQALESMTIDAAFAGFEEDIKGSITPGKYADFVVLDKDILTCPESEIRETKIVATYIGGEKKYSN